MLLLFKFIKTTYDFINTLNFKSIEDFKVFFMYFYFLINYPFIL